MKVGRLMRSYASTEAEQTWKEQENSSELDCTRPRAVQRWCLACKMLPCSWRASLLELPICIIATTSHHVFLIVALQGIDAFA